MQPTQAADEARHELAVFLLFAGQPSDRALTGWDSPFRDWGAAGIAEHGRKLAEVICDVMRER